MMSRKTWIELTKPLGMALATFVICSLVFLLDHEVNGIADLFSPGVWPAYLLYGLPIWFAMLVEGYLLQKSWRWAFVASALLCGFALGGLVWLFASHAQTSFGQIRNLLILGGLASLAFGTPVALIHKATEAAHRHLGTSAPST